MTLQTSGGLAASQILAEFGSPTPFKLSEHYRGGGNVPNIGTNSGVPLSGPIKFSQFYGAAAGATADAFTDILIGTNFFVSPYQAEAETVQLYLPNNYTIDRMRVLLWGGGGGGASWPAGAAGGSGGELTDIALDDLPSVRHLIGEYPTLSVGAGGYKGGGVFGLSGRYGGHSQLIVTNGTRSTALQWYMAQGGPPGFHYAGWNIATVARGPVSLSPGNLINFYQGGIGNTGGGISQSVNQGQGGGGAGMMDYGSAAPGESVDGLGLRALAGIHAYPTQYGFSLWGRGGFAYVGSPQSTQNGRWPAGGGGGADFGLGSHGANGAAFMRLYAAPGAIITVPGTAVGDPLSTTLSGSDVTPGLMTFRRNGTCSTVNIDQYYYYYYAYLFYYPLETYPWLVNNITGANPPTTLGDEFFISFTRSSGNNNHSVIAGAVETQVNNAGETCYRMNADLQFRILNEPGQPLTTGWPYSVRSSTFIARIYHQGNLNLALKARTFVATFTYEP